MRRLFQFCMLLQALILAMSACAPAPRSTPFIPPAPQPLPTTTPVSTSTPTEMLPTATLAAPPNTATPSSLEFPAPTASTCTNDLTFVQDITVPDGSLVQPGSSVEKEWLVTNSGTCDWDASYRLKWVGGDTLGAEPEQALFPARAGAQVTLRIVFTAPLEAGTYQSAWQAFAPDGTAFGEIVYLQILVGSP